MRTEQLVKTVTGGDTLDDTNSEAEIALRSETCFKKFPRC